MVSGRVPFDGQFNCCICGSSGVTLLWLRPTDLVVLAMRRWLGGGRWSSAAVTAVINRISIITLMAILIIKIRIT